MKALAEAILIVDIKQLVFNYFPEAQTPHQNRVKCVWRKGVKASGYFFTNQQDSKCKLYDPVSNRSYDAMDVLTELVGMTKQKAVQAILGLSGVNQIQQTKKELPASRVVSQPPIMSQDNPQLIIQLERWITRNRAFINAEKK